MHNNKQTKKVENNIVKLFFALVQCGIGKRVSLPATPSAEEWRVLYDMAIKQTLVGIVFAGVERLPKEQHPPRDILLTMHRLSVRIKHSNIELNRKCVAVAKKFAAEGFKSCILKGQGIAQLYPDPGVRTPGDIDIWLKGSSKEIIGYVKKFFPNCKPTYHHVDFPVSSDVDIEIHYRPTWMYNPFTNKRLQRYFDSVAHEQFANRIETAEGCFPAPTVAFNRIYILLHIYRHLFSEGIGMRQLLDYYFVMQQPMSAKDRSEYVALLKRFGLKKFASAAMYAMQEMFGAGNGNPIVEPNRRLGKFLLREIMIAGNFGKYDSRYDFSEGNYSIKRLIEVIKHNSTLITKYTGETMWSPYFKIWHYFWRKRNG